MPTNLHFYFFRNIFTNICLQKMEYLHLYLRIWKFFGENSHQDIGLVSEESSFSFSYFELKIKSCWSFHCCFLLRKFSLGRDYLSLLLGRNEIKLNFKSFKYYCIFLNLKGLLNYLFILPFCSFFLHDLFDLLLRFQEHAY